MRLLFEIDTKDYDINGEVSVRPSARAIIIKNGKIALIHSIKYDYYKFPGGGIEQGESRIVALIRETQEESGLIIKPETIREYGYVFRKQKGKKEGIFIQENFYYLCDVEDEIINQKLDGYEAEEHFTLEFVDPREAIYINRKRDHGPKDHNMINRETRVLELLIEEGLFR